MKPRDETDFSLHALPPDTPGSEATVPGRGGWGFWSAAPPPPRTTGPAGGTEVSGTECHNGGPGGRTTPAGRSVHSTSNDVTQHK